MPFRALGLDAQILKAVQEAGYTEPTPIQTAAIPPILAGHDLIGIAQTGTGKTAAFVLPILTKLASDLDRGDRHRPRALVVAPTRELVAQIEENVRIYGKHLPLRAAMVFGGVSERPQIDALRAGVDLVVATPGRLLDLMGRRLADFSGLNFWCSMKPTACWTWVSCRTSGASSRTLPQKRQTLLFSATLSPEIEAVTHEFLRAPKIVQIGRRANPAETVTQFVYEVPKHLKPALLVHLLRDPGLNMVLVFSRMKHGADRIARRLESAGVIDRDAALQPLAKPAAARLERFQVRRRARAGGDGHRRPRH